MGKAIRTILFMQAKTTSRLCNEYVRTMYGHNVHEVVYEARLSSQGVFLECHGEVAKIAVDAKAALGGACLEATFRIAGDTRPFFCFVQGSPYGYQRFEATTHEEAAKLVYGNALNVPDALSAPSSVTVEVDDGVESKLVKVTLNVDIKAEVVKQ